MLGAVDTSPVSAVGPSVAQSVAGLNQAERTQRAESDKSDPARRREVRGPRDTRKIDALIADIEGLEGATFIRNGEPHPAKDAAAHLRRKRDYAGDKITKAEQFIDELASKSSQSGEPYKIKLKEGTEVPAGDYLRQKLAEIEKSAPAK